MGRKEPGPYNPGKTWPGEAHKQPQLATQYYLRAQVEECLRIRNKVISLILCLQIANFPIFCQICQNVATIRRFSCRFYRSFTKSSESCRMH